MNPQKLVTCFNCHERVPLHMWRAHRSRCLAVFFECHACGSPVYGSSVGNGRNLALHFSSGDCDRKAADPAFAKNREKLAAQRAEKRAALRGGCVRGG